MPHWRDSLEDISSRICSGVCALQKHGVKVLKDNRVADEPMHDEMFTNEYLSSPSARQAYRSSLESTSPEAS